jgi:4-hydroxybenzoate polyprenyltransferase
MTTPASNPVRDAAPSNWVDKHAPQWALPYLRLARLDRPIGGWLLFWPCAWSTALAAIARTDQPLTGTYLLLFLIGAFAMRGAGCTWNDIVDRDIDTQVQRTRFRPLPSGQVSLKGACAFLALQLLIGVLVLICLPWFAIGVALTSVLPVISYPFMKRVTCWPQAVLGICFSWGALMGWAVAFESLSWPPVLLYLGAVAWVIGYDTVYALQDVEDDALVGVGSTALRFGTKAREGIAVFYTVAVGLLVASLISISAGFAAWLGLALFTSYLIAQVIKLDPADPVNCLMWFKSNHRAGMVLAAGFLADAVLRHGLLH